MAEPGTEGRRRPTLEQLGWRTRVRPPVALAHVIAAGAGVFAVVATVALAIHITSTDATAPGILLDLALAVVAFVAGVWLPGPVRSAAVVALLLTTPLIWFFAFYGDGQGGVGSLRWLYLLSILVYLVLFAVQWTRGRAVLLAGILFLLASWIQFEVSSTGGTVVPFQSQVQFNPFSTHVNSSSGGFLGVGGDDTATVALAFGAGYLAVGAVLNRRRFWGIATPFLVIGALEGLAGAAVLGTNERSAVLGGLVAALIGVFLLVAGAMGEGRRGSIWFGVLTVVGGVLAAIADAAHTTLGFAGYSALAAIGLLVISLVLAKRLDEAPDDRAPLAV